MINGKDQEIITINKTGNSILNNAKYSADNTDEWYTTYETIAEELSHYKNQFIDKVVLCNCDDPFESNFCYYFLRHFNQLKLKKLICTSYSGSKIDQLVNGQLTLDLLDADGNPVINNKHGYVLTITQIPGEHEEEVPDNVIKNVLQKKNVVRKLSGNGDFRSQECIEYLKECDICCTNPPFSLFSELFSLLVKYDKKYLLIGNQNAITYKEIFPYIKENKAWVGYRFGDMAFRVPQDTMPTTTCETIEKNNLHDLDTWIFFKWIFKTFVAVLLVTNTWNIVMGVFDITQSVVNDSAGVIISDTSIDIATVCSLSLAFRRCILHSFFPCPVPVRRRIAHALYISCRWCAG